LIRVSAGVWDGDPRVVDRTLAHQGRRVKHISGFSGFSPRGPWEAPAFIDFLNRDSICMPDEVSFPSVGLIGNRVLGPLVWFAGGMEVPELFLSTTVAWKCCASYPTKSFCCFVAVYQLQASRLEHRPHFCRKTEAPARRSSSVFGFLFENRRRQA
jgi:hypothetical protein